MKLKTVGLLSILAAVAVAAPVQAAPLKNRPKVHHMTKSQRHHFRVLRHARAAGDSLPAALANQALSDPLTSLYGVNLALSRQARGAAGGDGALTGIWVAPGNDAMCVYAALADTSQGSGVSACSSRMTRAVGGQLVAVVGGYGGLRGGEVRLFGLMPDGVRSVSVLDNTGQNAVAVVGNTYTVVADGPQQVRFADGNGAHVVDVPR
jgi:hypothetical protein